jgi:predicted regulator of Ras-like GTPase activity (Roadblock/LC7/MglB family)
MVILEHDLEQFQGLLDDLRTGANANYALLLDTTGQRIASSGELENVDPTSLASLTAGNVAATEGLAQLVGEPGFCSLHHEGNERNLHINLVSKKIILLVVFGEHSSLGLVRLRVQQATPALERIVGQLLQRTAGGKKGPAPRGLPVNEISDEDIDALFG